MKKIVTKAVFNILLLKEKAKETSLAILKDQNGSILTEYAGVIIVGLVIVGIVIVSAVQYTNNTFLPTMWSKITGFFNYGS
jgi:Flp pilus assembly pilin Flp